MDEERPNELPCQNCGALTDGKGTPEDGFAYAWFTGTVWEFWCPACAELGRAGITPLVWPGLTCCPAGPAAPPRTGESAAAAPMRVWSFWCTACAPARLRENHEYAWLRRVTRNGPWTMSPEEWVGRGGHKLALAGPLVERYDDPVVEEWCQDVMVILMDLPRRRALAEQYGTLEERRPAQHALNQALRPARCGYTVSEPDQVREGFGPPAAHVYDRGG